MGAARAPQERRPAPEDPSGVARTRGIGPAGGRIRRRPGRGQVREPGDGGKGVSGKIEFKELPGVVVGELLAGGISGDVVIGAAAVYNTVDAGGDLIVPGAFMATLAEKR